MTFADSVHPLSILRRRRAVPILAQLLGWLMVVAVPGDAQENAPLQALARMRVLLGQAETLHRQGLTNEALATATEAIRLAPAATEGWMLRGRLRAANGAFRDAAADFAKVLELSPRDVEARFQRALARFRDGRLARAAEDFDRLAQLAPDRVPQLWQRGVVLSLLGRHEEARQQFEAHRRINSNDVEVATWHFFSNAKLAGLETARSRLLPVTGDTRVPLPEIWRLYAGQADARAVFAAADALSDASARAIAGFYAHLYVALYLDAAGQPAEALPHARDAATQSHAYDFLGQAARLYADQLAGRVHPRPPAAEAAPEATAPNP